MNDVSAWPSHQTRWVRLVTLAGVALAYYLSGRLGLFLAIPPGYATAVWPASGIALAAVLISGPRIWPGVALGSFLINLPTGFGAGAAVPLSSFWIPGAIALGAALQAVVGAALIRRFLQGRDLLDLEAEVIGLLLMGGPLGCVVSASIGVGALELAGKIPPEGLLLNWVTWWVGDSIGVLVFVPLVLMWARKPWRGGPPQRLWVSVPLAITFSVVVVLFFNLSTRENERVREGFDRWCDAFLDDVGDQLERDVTALHALRGIFEGGKDVDRVTFDGVAGALIARQPELRALAWAVPVRAADRAEFEEQARAEYSAAFGLHDVPVADPVAEEVTAPIAIRLISPLLGNAPALGLNLASDFSRLRALRRAAETGREAATGPVLLVQDPSRVPALVLVLPVYEGAATRRGGALRGYVTAAVPVADAISAPVAQLESHGVRLTLTDLGDGVPKPMYTSFGTPGAGDGLLRDEMLTVAGRSWRAQMHLPQSELMARRSWETWILLVAGMLFTALLGMFLLVVFNRGQRVQRLVESRTAELAQSNRELSRELERGESLRRQAQSRASQLEATNLELEQFAYIVSHDLQAPLRSIGNFAQLIERKSADRLDTRGREFLTLIREGVGEMQRLIEALLRMSRLTRQTLQIELVDSQRLVQRVCETLSADIAQQQAEVHFEDLPRVYGDADLLVQLFQNLIGNGIKFRRPGVAPRVSITARAQDGEWRFSVEDNGTGLSPQNLGRLFQVFRRFHSSSEYPGTGIGLALCRKIVQLHGGRIWAESEEGKGSVFHFTLPQEPTPTPAAEPV